MLESHFSVLVFLILTLEILLESQVEFICCDQIAALGCNFVSVNLIGGTMADRYQQLKDLIDSFEQDFQKFYDKQNKAAGVRVRKHMQELRQLAQDIRGEVQDMKGQWDSQG